MAIFNHPGENMDWWIPQNGSMRINYVLFQMSIQNNAPWKYQIGALWLFSDIYANEKMNPWTS